MTLSNFNQNQNVSTTKVFISWILYNNTITILKGDNFSCTVSSLWSLINNITDLSVNVYG